MVKPIQDTSDNNRKDWANPKYIRRQNNWSNFQSSMNGGGKQGRGRWVHGARGERGCGRGKSYHSPINNLNDTNKGFCSDLGKHVFDYGNKWAADKMSITWDKIVNHVGTIYGHDIIIELQNKKQINIPQPKHTQLVKDTHLKRDEGLRYQKSRLMQTIEVKLQLLEAAVQRYKDPEVPVKLEIIINVIDDATYQATVEPAINLDKNNKIQYENECYTHREG